MLNKNIKFNRYHVVDVDKKTKSRIFYSLDGRRDGKKCVTLYAKDYDRTLREIFIASYINDTDSMTDYFETGHVNLFEDHPLYATARSMAESIIKQKIERLAKE